MIDLASAAVGGRIVACNDEFFAEAVNLIQSSAPVWKEGVYTDRGKWMDGWETRRRREPGHDWCIIALGIPGRIGEVTVDTSHFTGNFPEAFSLEACGVGVDDRLEGAEWVEIIARTGLTGDTVATFPVHDLHRVTHVRFGIYPDGGVARLRVAGEAIPSREDVCPRDRSVDLVSARLGGQALEASDSHYSPPSNMLRPTDPSGMWDGWETRRRRGASHDWASFRLGMEGTVESVTVDTRHFKGNAPGWVALQVASGEGPWVEALARAEVEPDTVNVIPLPTPVAGSRVRLDLHPDGGVARFRVNGTPDPEAVSRRRVEYLNALFDPDAWAFFHTACASKTWSRGILSGRPYPDAGSVLEEAGRVFDRLDQTDWLEAFAGHPRIGERGDAVASREQAGAADADEDLREGLAEANRLYEERYGFTYIVYASGKTAETMLDIAQERLGNTREQEIANASAEQRQITATRLRRMLCLEQES